MSVLGDAKEIIRRRSAAAEMKADQMKHYVEQQEPELKTINEELGKTNVRLIQLMVKQGPESRLELSNLENRNRLLMARREELLKNLGLTGKDLEPQYTCPVCEDTGVTDGHYCDCLKKLVRKMQAEEFFKSAPLSECSFDNFNLDYYGPEKEHMIQIYEYCKCWAEDFGLYSPNVLMIGRTGLGKTHLSISMAKMVMEKGYSVVYGSTPQILSQMNAEYFGRLPKGASPLDHFTDCDLLILDDLGTEYRQQTFTTSAIYNLINTRYMLKKPTIINTNLSIEEIKEDYSERIVSRLIGGYTPLYFLGQDIRQLKLKG